MGLGKMGRGFGRLSLLSGGGGATGFSPAAVQFFDRLATPPTDERAVLYAASIDATVAAGVSAKLDWLHVCAAVDQATALTNLISGSFNGIKGGIVGNPTFTQDRGWVGSPTAYISSQYNPSSSGGLFSQNSASVSVWGVDAAAASQHMLFYASNNDEASIYPRYTSGTRIARINSATDIIVSSITDGRGLHTVSRTASNLTTLFTNGVSIGTSAAASIAVRNEVIVYSNTSNCGLAAGGAGLDATEAAALYNAWLPYMQGVGAVA